MGALRNSDGKMRSTVRRVGSAVCALAVSEAEKHAMAVAAATERRAKGMLGREEVSAVWYPIGAFKCWTKGGRSHDLP
jgi:hypothetical protein